MKRLFSIFFILCLLLCAGCIKVQEAECNPPYIKDSGMCCIDEDQDGVCDAGKDLGPLEAESGDGITPVGLK